LLVAGPKGVVWGNERGLENINVYPPRERVSRKGSNLKPAPPVRIVVVSPDNRTAGVRL